MDKSAILVVSFGTTDESVLEKTIGALEQAAEDMHAGVVRRAFTGTVIRRKLRQQGLAVDTPAEALDRLSAEGFRRVTILPTFLAPGGEYRRLQEQVESGKKRFDRLEVLPPLMGEKKQISALGEVLRSRYLPGDKEAVLFMGHGTDGEGNECYRELKESFGVAGMHVALLKGQPDFETALEAIVAEGASAVRLVPLMLSAGVHAAEQMAGSDGNSWASRCTAAGLHVRCEMTGLAELEAVRQLYVAALIQEDSL